MAIPYEFATVVCGHCEKAIPAPNIDLHHAHCSRNLEKCRICGEMISKRHAEEHYMSFHAPVACSQCSETIEREVLALHKGENCPQRIVTCEYCEFPLPAVDLFKHQEFCGNRTEYCDLCNKYVRLCERRDHEIHFHSNLSGMAESSRDESGTAEREQSPPRQQAHGSSRRRIFFTIAIAGIAIIIGSFFLQKRVDTRQQQ